MLVLPAKPPDLLGHLLGVRSGRVLAPLTRGWTSSCAPPEQSLLPAPQAVGRDPEIFGDPLEGSTAADVEIDGLSPELFRIRWFGFGHVRIPFSDCALSVHRFGGSSPAIEGENVVVRYHRGRAYYVNKNDWKIVRVVDLDTSIKAENEDTAFVAGYVIPEERRTRFVEVPNPDDQVNVRYYNNTAYYMDSSYQIVRTVPLIP